MARTKGDTVRAALAKIGVTGYGYEIAPDELRDGLILLENLMASWDADGIKTGYKFADTPETAQAESDTGLPDIAYKAVDSNLALDLADLYGKQVSQLLLNAASAGYSQMLSATTYIPEMAYGRRMPRGSGNTFRWTRWSRFYRNENSLDADNAGPFSTDGNGDILV
jgi:hypothetical protein